MTDTRAEALQAGSGVRREVEIAVEAHLVPKEWRPICLHERNGVMSEYPDGVLFCSSEVTYQARN